MLILPGVPPRASFRTSGLVVSEELDRPDTSVGVIWSVTTVAGWSSPVAREAHNLEVAGSNPVPAIRPVSVTGASFEEPAATSMVAAGSVVLCGSVLSRADACCVAFCVAGALQSALQLDGTACPAPATLGSAALPPATTSSKWCSRDIK